MVFCEHFLKLSCTLKSTKNPQEVAYQKRKNKNKGQRSQVFWWSSLEFLASWRRSMKIHLVAEFHLPRCNCSFHDCFDPFFFLILRPWLCMRLVSCWSKGAWPSCFYNGDKAAVQSISRMYVLSQLKFHSNFLLEKKTFRVLFHTGNSTCYKQHRQSK